ncbi:MAG: phosphatase PAP2 family protein [Candidatus Sumerlaeaceae bacterium]
MMPIPPRPRLRYPDLILPLLVIALGITLIPWGAQIFLQLQPILERLPIKHLWAIGLQFANPFMGVLVALAILFLDAKKRYLVAYLIVGMLMAGAVNSTIKELTGRRRPEWSVAMNAERERDMRELAAKQPHRYLPVERRDIWSGLRSDRLWFTDKNASFPSGHAAAAFGLAAFLCLAYPQARVLWVFLAVLAALVRVKSAHHYLEDVMVGGALAWIVAQWTYTWRWPGLLSQKIAKLLGCGPGARIEDVPRKKTHSSGGNLSATADGGE